MERSATRAVRHALSWTHRQRTRNAARDGLPPAWHESPLRQLQRWSLEAEGLLDDLRARGDAHTLDLLGVGRVVVLFRKSAIRAVMSASPDDLGHNNDLAAFFVGSKSPLLLNGDDHAHARKRMLPLISGPALGMHGPTMLAVGEEWVRSLRVGQRVSALEAAQHMTLHVIMRTVFGMQPGPEYDELHALSRRFLAQENGGALKTAALVLPPALVREWVLGSRDAETADPRASTLQPSWWPVPESARAGRELMAAVLAQVRRRRASLDDGGVDALAGLMRRGIEQGRPLSDAEALDEAVTLLLAGHETTAASLGWLLYRAGRAPELWARLRDAVQPALSGATRDVRALETEPLLVATLQESLRLDGLAAGLARRARRDTVVDGIPIASGTVVVACTRDLHFSPERWGEPHRFDPGHMTAQRVEPLDLVPFGGGYRRCTGAAFAELELKLLFASIVANTTLRTPPECRVPRRQDGAFPAPGSPIWMDVVELRTGSELSAR